MHFHTFWTIAENTADWIQHKIFLYPVVLEPVGQVFNLICRADITLVLLLL